MVKKLELLVHAGAPSRRSDDARYTAQANVYLGFKGAIVGDQNVISNRAVRPLTDGPMFRPPPTLAQPDRGWSSTYNATTFLDDTQLAWSALDSQLIPSTPHIPLNESTRRPEQPLRSDVGPQKQCIHAHAGESSPTPDNTQGSAAKTPSSGISKRCHPIADDVRAPQSTRLRFAESQDPSTAHSSYLRSPDLDRSAKRPRLSRLRREKDAQGHQSAIILSSTPRIEAADAMYQAIDGKHPRPTEAARSQTSLGQNGSTSELPTSYSLSEFTSGSSKARAGISQRSSSDPGPQITPFDLIAPRQAEISAATRASGDCLPETGLQSFPSANIHEPRGVPQDVDSGGNHCSAEAYQLRALPEDASIIHKSAESPFASLSTTIQPPRPPVSSESYTTHVTSKLQILGEDPLLKHCFRPAVVTTLRTIRPLERGYWLIKSPPANESWTTERQVEFWKFLERVIGNGSVGWGVWCTREPLSDKMNGLGLIKIYCWGEVIKHLYHLLYVTSSSQVRKMGLQWIDSEEKVAVEMRSP